MQGIVFGLGLLAQALPAEAEGRIPSVWDFIMRGGLRMAPLFPTRRAP